MNGYEPGTGRSLRFLHIAPRADIVSHVKTTVEISDSLMAEARAVAARERNTLRALVEEGLRKVLAERREVGRFRPRKATFRGKGLPSHLAPGSWERIRDSVYEERGA